MGGPVRYACEWAPSGIGTAAQRALRAILSVRSDLDVESDRALDIAWEPLSDAGYGRQRAVGSGDAPAWLRALRRPRVGGEVVVQHSVPGAWKQVASELRPARQIGHSVWELDDVPHRWIDEMSDVDEFWVPTEWNRAAYARAFDRPVHVVPHVVSDALPAPIPMPIPEDVAVVSLVSAWDWRKRPDRAIEAFCHAFTRADSVALAVKTNGYAQAWPGGVCDVVELIHRITEQFPNPPIVYYDVGHWSDAQMLGLADRSACFLSLTSTEGWGLGAFDAASLGTPVIITGFGGQLAYLGDDYPGLLPYRRTPTSHSDRALFELGTEWAYPDLDAAVDLLRAVVDGSAHDLVDRARSLAPDITDRYSVDRVGSQMVELLERSTTQVADASRSTRSPALPTGREHSMPTDEVVVLTPVKNAAHHAAGYVDRVLALEHPQDHLRVAVLVSDSTDGSADAFRTEFARLRERGVTAEVHEHDFGYHIPPGVPRWTGSIQLERRTVLAKSRNHLLSRALGDADWALWIDVDVVEYPTDVVDRLVSVGGDIVHPHCVGANGRTFDHNAWTDLGRHHLDAYRGHGLVELHAVGGTMLLVRADRHRDGLIWPAHLHGVANPRVRTDPTLTGRPEIGEIETEGLAILADDMGITCWGLPDLLIRHE
ncbi:MAG: hypothetical protein WBP59_11460 [Ilumatobacteraceae bacterium]